MKKNAIDNTVILEIEWSKVLKYTNLAKFILKNKLNGSVKCYVKKDLSS